MNIIPFFVSSQFQKQCSLLRRRGETIIDDVDANICHRSADQPNRDQGSARARVPEVIPTHYRARFVI